MVRIAFWRSILILGISDVLGRKKSIADLGGDEARLLRLVRNGNSAAFGELLQMRRTDVENYLRRRLPQDAVEDVLQETLVAAWVNFGRFESDRSLKLWLLGIAQNKAKDFWRSQVGIREDQSEWATFEVQSYLQVEFHNLELRESLRDVWRDLPPTMREPLELYYGQRLSFGEIAVLLDTNVNTVKYRFYRAQAYLAENLDPKLVENLIQSSGLQAPGHRQKRGWGARRLL